jgi:hypothetical protein
LLFTYSFWRLVHQGMHISEQTTLTCFINHSISLKYPFDYLVYVCSAYGLTWRCL